MLIQGYGLSGHLRAASDSGVGERAVLLCDLDGGNARQPVEQPASRWPP